MTSIPRLKIAGDAPRYSTKQVTGLALHDSGGVASVCRIAQLRVFTRHQRRVNIVPASRAKLAPEGGRLTA